MPSAVTVHPVPFNRSLSVMITHDVDYSESMGNSLIYALYKKNEGIRATYFIQTKYIRDWNDEIFFNDEKVSIVKKLEEMGMEVGSHSVSHSKTFKDFPFGTGREQYPTYRPVVKSRFSASHGTVLGELRVSKFLLESFMDEGRVLSFRPGHLSNPISLSRAMMAAGYLYSSSVTANISLTHLPFQLNIDRGYEMESNIYEFPITVEDELPPEMGSRLPQAIKLAEDISSYGGAYVVLIHPNIIGHKLRFLKGFIPAVKDYAFFATISEFGKWWSARDQVEADVFNYDEKYWVRLRVPKLMRGLTLEIPEGSVFLGSDPSSLDITQHGNRLVIKEAFGLIKIFLSTNRV